MVVFLKKDNNQQFLDLRLAVVTDSGIAMINVSPERRMINLVNISADKEIWVPGGLGWYQGAKIKKLLEQEKKTGVVSQMLFLNYGFSPEAVLWKSDWNGELSNTELLKYWGIKGWLNYRWNSGNWLFKTEQFTPMTDEGSIDEVMERDMAESTLFNQEIKITVGNASNADGLGSFVTKALERSGLDVVDVVNVNEAMMEACLIKNNGKQKVEWLKAMLPECKEAKDLGLADGDMEIYFGQAWAEMINYASLNQ